MVVVVVVYDKAAVWKRANEGTGPLSLEICCGEGMKQGPVVLIGEWLVGRDGVRLNVSSLASEYPLLPSAMPSAMPALHHFPVRVLVKASTVVE